MLHNDTDFPGADRQVHGAADAGREGRVFGGPVRKVALFGYFEGAEQADIKMAAELTVVEVDQMVELGEMDPEAVVTPSIFVDRIVVVGANA